MSYTNSWDLLKVSEKFKFSKWSDSLQKGETSMIYIYIFWVSFFLLDTMVGD